MSRKMTSLIARFDRIGHNGHPSGFRHQLAQKCQPLGQNLRREKIDAGCIAARPGKAGDQSHLDRVFADAKDDRYRRVRSFGYHRSLREWGGNHGHASADQVGHERRRTIVVAL
jgi:hypothetical protein